MMAKRATRLETEQRLLDAVGDLLAEAGFSAVGINAIARCSGVNKALIYRYFGGLDGLLSTWAEHGDFWPTADELVPDRQAMLALPIDARVGELFVRYLRALRRRPRTVEILAWEVVDRNELTAQLEAVRERRGKELAVLLTRPGEGAHVDQAALTALLSASIHYLLIRARKIRTYNTLALDREEGWTRVEAAVRSLAAAFQEVP